MHLDELKEGLLLWGLPPRQGIAEIKKQVAAEGLCVLVPEMRPHLLGIEVARRLAKENIKHLYATDNMLGILFSKRKIKEVLFFYKDLADQKFWGICGSLYACLLAHLHHVPIKTMQAEKKQTPSRPVPLLDEYMRINYNDVLETDDEAVPEEIIR